MEIIEINEKNIDGEHICCALGGDKDNTRRALSKKEWMKANFKNGLIFRRSGERGKVFIEFMPVEKSWKPVSGKNIMLINCLWVSGKFKGKGLSGELLNNCIATTKKEKKDGIAVVTASKTMPFLTDKNLYEKFGFVPVDKAPPYFELMFLKLNAAAKNPSFNSNAKTGLCSNKKGFTIIYSSQCPFMDEYVTITAGEIKKRKIQCEVIKLDSYKQAQETGSPFGTLGIYYKGEFKTHELMPDSRLNVFLDNTIK